MVINGENQRFYILSQIQNLSLKNSPTLTISIYLWKFVRECRLSTLCLWLCNTISQTNFGRLWLYGIGIVDVWDWDCDLCCCPITADSQSHIDTATTVRVQGECEIGGSHKNYFERTSFFLICIHKLCGKTRGAKTANENDYVTQGQLYLL